MTVDNCLSDAAQGRAGARDAMTPGGSSPTATVEWREAQERLADFARTLASGDEVVVDAALVVAYKTKVDQEHTQYWVLAMPGVPDHATVGLLHVGIDAIRWLMERHDRRKRGLTS